MLCQRMKAESKELTDRGFATGCTILGGYFEKTIGVNLERSHELGLTTGHRWNASELKLAQQTVVAALCALALVSKHSMSIRGIICDSGFLHRESDRGLVVFDGGECPRLVGWNWRVSWDDDSENVTLHGNTEGERCNIKEKKILSLFGSLSREHSSLDSGTIGNCLVRIDRLVQGASPEIFRDKGLDFWNTSGTSHKNDFVDFFTGHLSVLEHFVNGL
jgi:hypothetical protein